MDKNLIKKYLEGQCSPEEVKLIRDFMLRPDAQKLFDEVWKEEWGTLQRTDKSELEILKLEHRFLEKLKRTETGKEKFKIVRRFSILKYAAVWLLLVSGVTFIVWKTIIRRTPEIVMQEHTTNRGELATITLDDSTIVYLGPESTLRFPESFQGKTREVELIGEAFFEVKHNLIQPFLVHTGNITTHDIGTSFKISAFENQRLMVSVATGKVMVECAGPKQISSSVILLPGENVTLKEKSSSLLKGKESVNEIINWQKGLINFNSNTLAEITRELERYYHVKFNFNNEGLTKRRITTKINIHLPINDALKILGNTAHCAIAIHGNTISFYLNKSGGSMNNQR